MKLKQGMILTKMDDTYVAVAAGDAGKTFNGMIRMNGTASFLVERMQQETTEDALVEALLQEYDSVTPERARAAVERVIADLSAAGLLE